MNIPTEATAGPRRLIKQAAALPALIVTGRESVSIRAGIVFADVTFNADVPVSMPEAGLEPGADYVIVAMDLMPFATKLTGPTGDAILGGFHFAPGGNAPGRSGGDAVPAINRHSVWDINFRPACPDPRGMALVEGPAGPFWGDIYLTAKDHLTNGTSQFGAVIADGDDPPQNPAGGYFRRFDYETALAVMKHHGKGLMSVTEFFAAAIGVTEKSARNGDPEKTGLDAARTSRWGLMQATGNMWAWGHDGDPDEPRPSVFGGSWIHGSNAGSRYAGLGLWPGRSNENLGARGRSDHLQLG